MWLHDAGYTTGLVGKYLNNYPFGGAPYVPPGWDRWFAKENTNESTAYFDYDVVDQGVVRSFGDAPEDYATDVLGGAADAFLRAAPASEPWFLYFSPNAPHGPVDPRASVRHAFDGFRPPMASPQGAERRARASRDTSARCRRSAPRRWKRSAPEDLAERRTLLSVDDVFRELVATITARGELDRTVIIFMTDNGFEFGQHRLQSKRFPYEPSIGVPFAIRTPWAKAATMPDLVVERRRGLDDRRPGRDLATPAAGRHQPGAARVRPGAASPSAGVWLDWGGDAFMPPWTGVRTARFTYVDNADGTEELYLHASDPGELRNLAGVPRFRALLERARSLRDRLAPARGGG